MVLVRLRGWHLLLEYGKDWLSIDFQDRFTISKIIEIFGIFFQYFGDILTSDALKIEPSFKNDHFRIILGPFLVIFSQTACISFIKTGYKWSFCLWILDAVNRWACKATPSVLVPPLLPQRQRRIQGWGPVVSGSRLPLQSAVRDNKTFGARIRIHLSQRICSDADPFFSEKGIFWSWDPGPD